MPIILLNAHADQVTAMALSPDGRLLACADSANALCVWDTEATRLLHRGCAHQGQVHGLAFSPDGGTLASGGADRQLHLWDAGQGRLLRQGPCRPEESDRQHRRRSLSHECAPRRGQPGPAPHQPPPPRRPPTPRPRGPTR